MVSDKHKVDDIFRDGLSYYPVTPPPEVWDRVAESLGHSKRKKRALFIWITSSAAALLFAFLLGWNLSQNNNTANEMLAQMSNQKIQINTVVFDNLIEVKPQIIFEHKCINPINKSLAFSYLERLKKENKREANFALLASNSVLLSSSNLAYPELEYEKKESFFSNEDRSIMESNLLAMNSEITKKERSWSLGVQGSPISRFDEFSVLSDLYDADPADYANADAPASNNDELTSSYNTNLSFGVTFAYNVNDKISFISGANYSDVSQIDDELTLLYSSVSWEEQYTYAVTASNNAVRNTLLASNNASVSTNIGTANISFTAKGIVTLANSEASTDDKDAEYSSADYEYDQHARYVEIPMLMRYKILDKKIGVNVLAGVNTNVLVDNSVSLINNNEIVGTGEIENLRALSWSTSWGMGVNYEILKNIDLSIEPTLKVQLTSLSSSSEVSAKPYSFGVFSGLSYRF